MVFIPDTRHGPSTPDPGPVATVVEGPKLPDYVIFPDNEVGRLPASQIPRIEERRVAVAGEGALHAVAMGRVPVHRPRVFAIGYTSTKVVLGLEWCLGECQSIDALYNGDELFTGDATHYTGTSGQTADPWLAAVIDDYDDDLPGICYSVVRIASAEVDTALNLSAIVKGLKLYDPRSDTTVYSDNPALMFRHVANVNGILIDDDNIGTAADYCDETVGAFARWSCGLLFDRPREIDQQLALIAEYAGCFYIRDGGAVKLLPDAPTSVTHSFSDDADDIAAGASEIVIQSLTLEKRALRNFPNQSIVQYTQPWSGFPWRTGYAETSTPSGDIRPTTFRMEGFQSFNVARRFALERQNRFNLCDLLCTFEAFDEALPVEVGDVIELTHNIGLNAKQFRVLNIEAGSDIGLWRISGEEYDPSVYSNSEVSDPTYPDIDLPNPGNIPTGPTPTMVEKLFVEEGGRTLSRWEISWTGTDFLFASAYRVRVSSGSDIFYEGEVTHLGEVTHKVATGPVKQDVSYLAEVWIINVFGHPGDDAGTATETALGKLLLPTAPSNLQGFEAGQFVSLNWTDSIDIDLIGYRVKRVPKADYDADRAGAWDHANAVLRADRHDATRILLNAEPVGEFYYMVKALDSLGQESDSAVSPYGRADALINVTANAAGSLVLEELDAATVVNMFRTERYGDGVYYITSDGASWLDDGPAGDSWLDDGPAGDTWIEGIAVASSLETEEWDVDEDKEANWTWSPEVTVRGGTTTYTTRIAKEADYPTFSDQAGASFTGELRYLKAKIECTGAAGDGMEIKMPLLATFQGQIQIDRQDINIPASPGQPYSLVWGKNFSDVPDFEWAVLGSSPRIIAFDNVDEDGADVYSFDTGGSQVAATVRVTATGT